MRSSFALLAFVSTATAFPGLIPGELGRGRRFASGPAVERRAAEPYSPKYPYTGAKLDGQPGTGVGGVQVPAPGDTAHSFQHPPVGAYRGPCPGLNAAANHGFLSRDGITDLNELIAAQQNVFNFGWDLSYTFAHLAVAFSGDITTGKVSIGADATWATSAHNHTSAPQGGLNAHNLIEVDGSLTRNDYYLGGNNYGFNGTLWQEMIDVAKTTSNPHNPLLDFNAVAKYRGMRYNQSRAGNPNFSWGPACIINLSADVLVYEVMPNSAQGSLQSVDNAAWIFGASKAAHGPGNATGGWDFIDERLPPNWHNRVDTFNLTVVTAGTLAQYKRIPQTYGYNDHSVNNFVELPMPINGLRENATGRDVACQIYESFADMKFNAYLSDTPKLPQENFDWIIQKLQPIFGSLNCTHFPGF